MKAMRGTVWAVLLSLHSWSEIQGSTLTPPLPSVKGQPHPSSWQALWTNFLILFVLPSIPVFSSFPGKSATVPTLLLLHTPPYCGEVHLLYWSNIACSFSAQSSRARKRACRGGPARTSRVIRYYCDAYRIKRPISSGTSVLFLQTVSFFGSSNVVWARRRLLSTFCLKAEYSAFRIVDIRIANRIISAFYIQFDFDKSNIRTAVLFTDCRLLWRFR